jgi:hypothetical protein
MEEIKTINFERVPLKNRLGFQLVLMKIMLGEKTTHEAQNEWADRYGKRVSDIIDATNRSESPILRPLIMSGDPVQYTEASKMLIEILKSEEMGKAA